MNDDPVPTRMYVYSILIALGILGLTWAPFVLLWMAVRWLVEAMP